MMKWTAPGLLRVGVILLLAVAAGGLWIWNSNVRVPATAQDPIELEASPSDGPGQAETGPPQQRDPGSPDGATPVSSRPLPAGVTSTGDDDADAATDDADDAPDDHDDTAPDVGSDDDDDDDGGDDPAADDDDDADGDDREDDEDDDD